MSHTDLDADKRLTCARILVLDCGGYTVRRDEGGALPGAAFSTLPEALAWLQRNMKQPASPLDDMSQGRTREETLRLLDADRDAAAEEYKRRTREEIADACRRIMAADPRTFPPASDPIGSKAQ